MNKSPNYNTPEYKCVESPLYEPKTPDFNGCADDYARITTNPSNVQSPQYEAPIHNYIQKVNTRKRIYGEEYQISTYLDIIPASDPKISKIEQPIFETHPNTTYRNNEVSATATTTTIQPPAKAIECIQYEAYGHDYDENDDDPSSALAQAPPAAAPLDDDDDNEEDSEIFKSLNGFEYKFQTPIPSITKRPYISFALNKNDIPKICSMCFAIDCVCSILSNKKINYT